MDKYTLTAGRHILVNGQPGFTIGAVTVNGISAIPLTDLDTLAQYIAVLLSAAHEYHAATNPCLWTLPAMNARALAQETLLNLARTVDI